MKLTAKVRLSWDNNPWMDVKEIGAVNCGFFADVWIDVDVEQVDVRTGLLIEYIEDEGLTDDEFETLGYYYNDRGNLPVGIRAVEAYGLPDKVRLLDTDWEVEDGDA